MFVILLAVVYPDNATIKLIWFPPYLATVWTLGWLAMKRFMNRFSYKFDELGRPDLFGLPSDPNNWKFKQYLKTDEFLELGDSYITFGFGMFKILPILGLILYIIIAILA